MSLVTRFLARGSVLAILGLALAQAEAQVPAPGLAPAPAPLEAFPSPVLHGVDIQGMDRSVAPGDDFFRYANGSWLKSTPIPADRSSEGAGDVLEDLTNQRIADLIRSAAHEKAPAGSESKKIGDFFTSFMDEEGIEAKGLNPLQPALDRIAAVADRTALAAVLGATLRADVDALNATDLHTDNLFGLWVAQDLDAPARYVPFLLQGGLGMPDRDYYLDPSPAMAEVRTAYQSHIAKVLRLASVTDPEAKAGRIFTLELSIAKVHWTRMDTGDVRKGDNHWTRKEFDTRAPGLNWTAFFAGAGLDHQTDFVVWQPSAVTGLSALVGAEPLDTWKDYLTFHAIDRASGVLPKALVEEQFAFYGRVLSGTPELRVRWKRAVEATNDALGEAVGKLYVERYFPPAEKARLQAMVRNILAAFGKRIDALPWMAPATKVQAKAKLAVLKVGVGYPDRWINFEDLEVVSGDAFGNAERAELFQLKRNLRKLGHPVDRGEWVMSPQTVNAVNLPAMNALNFPAAILQPPFLDPRRPEVMDYGATGATIGHEISHSFDDQGSLFDATGRLHDWWTKEDLKHFQASARQLVKQFDAYRPFPDLAINGRLTLGENIADVAGLAAAYDAYRLSQGGREAPALQGFSGDQQFFLSFAQSWREKSREPALRQQILTNGHAPAQYRACTVRNLDAWYPAFDVKPGQAQYLAPADRVRIW